MEFVERMLSGLCKHKPYRILCRVVDAGLSHMSEETAIGVLCAQVGAEIGKKEGAVYRALDRELEVLWEQEDRGELERLMRYNLTKEMPPTKEVVMALVSTLWEQSVRVEYRLQEGGLDRRVGISCVRTDLRTKETKHAVLGPSYRDREMVLTMIARWNREQMPMERFQDMVLLDQLREQ